MHRNSVPSMQHACPMYLPIADSFRRPFVCLECNLRALYSSVSLLEMVSHCIHRPTGIALHLAAQSNLHGATARQLRQAFQCSLWLRRHCCQCHCPSPIDSFPACPAQWSRSNNARVGVEEVLQSDIIGNEPVASQAPPYF